MPIKRYAPKVIMLPAIPSRFEPSIPGWAFHTAPIGAERWVTSANSP